MSEHDDQRYRALIDDLVRVCNSGQGQIGPQRARCGIWNVNATDAAGPLADQYAINELLGRLSEADREVVAGMLGHTFEGGVFETLKALHQAEVSPFDKAYEGEPIHDFIGRINGWEWPANGDRS